MRSATPATGIRSWRTTAATIATVAELFTDALADLGGALDAGRPGAGERAR